MGSRFSVIASPRLRVLFAIVLIVLFVAGAVLLTGSFHAEAAGGGDAGRNMRTTGVELMALSASAGLLASGLKARWSDD
jgi:hypothetical protein